MTRWLSGGGPTPNCGRRLSGAGSPLEKKKNYYGSIYLVIKERPFGVAQDPAGLRGTHGPPTIRATCAFALNFRASRK